MFALLLILGLTYYFTQSAGTTVKIGLAFVALNVVARVIFGVGCLSCIETYIGTDNPIYRYVYSKPREEAKQPRCGDADLSRQSRECKAMCFHIHDWAPRITCFKACDQQIGCTA